MLACQAKTDSSGELYIWLCPPNLALPIAFTYIVSASVRLYT